MEAYFKKIIYKRPVASGAQGLKLLPPRHWDKNQRGGGEAGGSRAVWDSPAPRSSQTPGTRTECQGPEARQSPNT